MDLSIFNDDDSFGDVGGRVVVLRGTTTVSQLFSPNLFNVDTWMLTGLRNRGFTVNAVRMSAAGWIGYSNNVEIETWLNNEFTAEEQRVAVQNAIGEITANYGANRVFYNTALSVVSDPNLSTGPGPIVNGGNVGTVTVYGNTGSGSQNPPSNYNTSNTPPTTGNFLDNLGLGLGVSTPIVIGGAALVALLLLKR